MPISYETLTNGERIGLGAVEITAVPHLSILQKRFSETANIDTEYKQDMARLLSEVFQNYKNAPHNCSEISLEILWTTQAVTNQPYKASITLHIIIRAIGQSDKDLESTINALMQICKATLDFGKYDYREADISELTSQVRGINNQSVKAVVKSESLENLQNSMVPFCFAFDKLPITENDMSRVVSALIDHPNTAVSFQLIPITYSYEEAVVVDSNDNSRPIATQSYNRRCSTHRYKDGISSCGSKRQGNTRKQCKYDRNPAAATGKVKARRGFPIFWQTGRAGGNKNRGLPSGE